LCTVSTLHDICLQATLETLQDYVRALEQQLKEQARIKAFWRLSAVEQTHCLSQLKTDTVALKKLF